MTIMETNRPKPLVVRGFDYLEDKLFQLGLIITLAMCLFIALNAAIRYLFGVPITGTIELTEEYLMPGLIFLSLSFVYKNGGHVRVTLLQKHIPPRLYRPIAILMDLLVLIFLLIITYASSITVSGALRDHEKTMSILAYPLAPAYAMAMICFGFLTIRVILSFFYPIKYRE